MCCEWLPNNFNKLIVELKNHGLNQIIFSLHGGNAETHDKITGVPGSFVKTISSVKKSLSINLNTELHFVPLALNYNELQSIITLSEKLRIGQISILRFVPQGRGKLNNNLLMKKADWLHFRKNIKKYLNNKIKIRLGSPLNILCIGEINRCKAGVDRMTILPDLTIVPCDAFKGAIGNPELYSINDHSNLKDINLAECWKKSKVLNFAREYIQNPKNKKCLSCNKYDVCGGGCIGQKIAYSKIQAATPDPECLYT